MNHDAQPSDAQALGSSRPLQTDQAMQHQALLESLTLCREILEIPSQIPSNLRPIISRIALRLAYVLAHNPPPRIDPADLVQLARFHHRLSVSLTLASDPTTTHLALRNLSL